MSSSPVAVSDWQDVAPPPATANDWQDVPQAPQTATKPENYDLIDVLASKVPLADRINKGLKEGVEAGFGLHDIDANEHPYVSALSQTWNNLKNAARESYGRMGGDVEMPGMPSGSNKVAAAALTPADMLLSGIDSMATLIESGSKEMLSGSKSKDPQAVARGFAKMMSGVGQAAAGAEEGGGAIDTAKAGASAAGTAAQTAAAVPGAAVDVTKSAGSGAKSFARKILIDPVTGKATVTPGPILERMLRDPKEIENAANEAKAQALMDRQAAQDKLDAAHESKLKAIEDDRQKQLAASERLKEQEARAKNSRKETPVPESQRIASPSDRATPRVGNEGRAATWSTEDIYKMIQNPDLDLATKREAISQLVLRGKELPPNARYIMGDATHGSATYNPRDVTTFTPEGIPIKQGGKKLTQVKED